MTLEPMILHVSDIGSPWIKTQCMSIAQQLHFGIRSLDLRIGQNSPGDYIICHGEWRTNYSLAQALKEVTDFIDNTTKEIVILDFHRFINLVMVISIGHSRIKS